MATGRNYRYTGSSGRSAYGNAYGSRRSSGQHRNGQNRNGRNQYVYDNLARQMEAVPERKVEPQRRRKRRVHPAPKPVAMPSISGVSFLFLSLAVVVTLFFCFYYLNVQSGLTHMKSEAVVLQGEIAEMRADNAEKEQQIMDSVDLAQVYETATEKLGMVQAVDNQVFRYRNKKSDMVKQYGDIPLSR